VKGGQISVAAYSGYRGEEKPRSFVIAGEKINVVGIEKEWIGEDAETGSIRRHFRIRGSDGFIHLLSQDEKTGTWYHS
jgi:hypothetical protein